ncbi:YkgJ family cysteine cluster protein [Candidatus Woesearchaeota archaeon]|nr:YkgJ family cysteine cluster protein [Candidatus Woesearchaeota archaeon]
MIEKKTELKEILKLAPACRCESCSHGCKMGSGLLADGDKKAIAKFLNVAEKELAESYLEEVTLLNRKMLRPKILREGKPYGRCMFYDDEKGCTVHPVKPLQCKVSMGCGAHGEELMAWFMLNHILDIDDPESIRQYSVYLKSCGKLIKGGKLSEIVEDKATLRKISNYTILR